MGDPAPEVTVVDGVTVIGLSAAYANIEVEDGKLKDLQTNLLQIADVADPPAVVLNLGNTKFFGSAFIETMFRLHNHLKDRGGKFAICCLTEYCAEVIEITHLNRVWTITETQEEAIAQVKPDA